MKDAKMSEYSKEAAKLGIPLVNFNDKKEITDYFTGVTSESAQIDTAKRAQTLIRKSSNKGGATEASQGDHHHHQGAAGQGRKRDEKAREKFSEQSAKALKDEHKEMSVTDYLARNEKAIHGRATVLQCRKKNFLKVLQLGY